MNTASVRPTGTPTASSRAADRSCRPEDPSSQRRGDEFDRLLRSKSAMRDMRDDSNDADGPRDADAGLAGLAAAAPSPLPRTAGAACGALALPAGSDSAGPAAPAVKLAREASLQSAPPPTALATGAADASATWSVSVNQPLGIALELRATRCTGPSAPEATWTLTIGSSAHDAAVLARHAPRLNERLRTRALTHTHVRIEGNEEEPS